MVYNIDMSQSEGDTKLALYRKYRPVSLDQVVGQPQVTEVLAAAAKAKAFAHAYLFTGQRGTGKTTVARILAHLVNGLDYKDNINSDNVDIIEIDAASNNGVDDVRQIRDSVQLAPMMCSHKVYIIDEFHMLSKPAFNALLKTIEEPPEYAVFILATTELQKVPATILSRVQRFHFKPLPPELLAKHLRMIADKEKINVDDDALLLIAKQGGGSVRDSITLLDQLSGSKDISVQTVNDILGLVSDEQIGQIVANVSQGEAAQIIKSVRDIIAGGTSATALAEQLISYLESQAVNQPQLYYLIDRLLDVSKSALPEAKLLSVLITATVPPMAPVSSQPVTPAGTSIVAEPAKPIIDDSAAVKPAKPTAGKTKNKEQPAAEIKPTQVPQQAKSESQPTATEQPEAESKPSAPATSIADLVWDDVLQQLTDQDRPSTRSVLEQCDYRYNADNNTLTIFFSNAFYRNRAKAQVFNDALSQTLDELYHCRPTIEISDDQAPADSDVAAVLSVVGGEVTKVNGQI